MIGSPSLIVHQIKELLTQHLKELKVFGSSCKTYRTFLTRFKGCPFQLYSLHISLRWNETIKAWHNQLREHESYCFVLNESVAFMKSLPNHSYFKDFQDLARFNNETGTKLRMALDYAFEKYRKLHAYVTNFISKIKNLSECKSKPLFVVF